MDSETYKKLDYILSGSGVTQNEKSEIVDLMEEYASQFKVEADSMEWISVEERLPEEEQIVLSFGNGERPSVSIYQSGRFDRWVDIVNGDRCMSVYYDSIRFWQPLPSPPLTVPDKQK